MGDTVGHNGQAYVVRVEMDGSELHEALDVLLVRCCWYRKRHHRIPDRPLALALKLSLALEVIGQLEAGWKRDVMACVEYNRKR
jgi:hypothetical protein